MKAYPTLKEKYTNASEEEKAAIVSQITEIDKGTAEVFVEAEELADFECEITDIS